MVGSDTNRGQIVAVEVLLLLGVLIVAFGMYQAVSVPDQNEGAEFEHSLEVQSDLVDYRNSLVDVRDNTQIDRWHQSVQIGLGLRYSPRIIGLNPSDPSGTIRTRAYGDIEIQNASVDGWFDGNPQLHLLESTHETRLLTYTTDYNEFSNGPTTIFEHSLLYNVFSQGTSTISNQRLINGQNREMNLVLFDGEISHSGQQITLDPKTLDGPTPKVPIEPSAGNITLVIPSVTPTVWNTTIGESFADGELNAKVVDTQENRVTIELRGNWKLQMARVGFDGGTVTDTFSNITALDPPFFDVTIDAYDQEVTEGDTITVDYSIENTGEVADIQDVEFRVNGTLEQVAPNVELQADETHSGTFTYQTVAGDTPELSVAVSTDNTSKTRLVTVSEPDPPLFDVTIIGTNEPVSERETLSVTAEIENLGDEVGTQDIELLNFDGTVVDTISAVTLAGGDSRTISLSWGTEIGDAGTDLVTVRGDDDSDATSATIEAFQSDWPFFDVDIIDTDEPVLEGEPLTVTAEVHNLGAQEDTQDIKLLNVSGHIVDSVSSVNLGPGETTTIDLTWDTTVGDAGTGNVVVRSDDTFATQGVVIGSLQPPTVDTLSATNIGVATATLNGNLTGLGTSNTVDVSFQYRVIGDTNWIEMSPVTVTETGTFDQAISGLASNTTYEFRAVAESTAGLDTGDTLTFTTQVPPGLVSVTANDVDTGTSVTQTFTFELTSSVQAGDVVELNLDDAYDTRGGQNRQIIYPAAEGSVSSTGDGSISIDSQGNQAYSILYTVAGADPGSQITITVADIDTSGANANSFVADFVLTRGGTLLDDASDGFDILP